jgi:micrococcal nuclease
MRPVPKAAPVLLYAVVRVIDGDTVEVGYHGGTSVRLIGIDTPETVSPSVPDECGGEAASRVAHELLDGRRVALRFDPSQGRYDRYGRTLAYLEVPGLGDYGLAMLERGRAAEYTYDSAYEMQRRYQRAEAKARGAGLHLWGRCGGPDTPVRSRPAPTPRAGAAVGTRCAPGYDPCVSPFPPDVDCADVDGPVQVTGDDPHGLDRDGDGVACEPS